MTTTTATRALLPTRETLSRRRLFALRAGYLFMGAGLVVVKWPLLPDASTLPLYEGVTLCLLVALSLLALLGLRHPVRLLPVLLFEVGWKTLWLSLVALPNALGAGLDGAARQIAVNCSLVIAIVAVIPWRYVWHHFSPLHRAGS